MTSGVFLVFKQSHDPGLCSLKAETVSDKRPPTSQFKSSYYTRIFSNRFHDENYGYRIIFKTTLPKRNMLDVIFRDMLDARCFAFYGIDCLLHKIFLIREHKPYLNIQIDSIKEKLFT